MLVGLPYTGVASQRKASANGMVSKTPSEVPDWLTRARNAYAVHNVTVWRPQLPFWLLLWDGQRGLEWMELTDPRQKIKPFHFEIYFGKEAVRDEHYFAALAEARATGQVVMRELFGFWDLWFPVPTSEGRHAFVYTGQFLRSVPTWESVSGQWRTLSGREPTGADPDFVRYVHMVLEAPVLEPELLESITEFARLYGDFLLSGGEGAEQQEAIDRLNREHISRLWPIEDWVESAISADKFELTPWYLEGELKEWMKEGMGIDRLPTTVLTLMPLDSRAEAMDPVRTLIRNAQIQRACIALARDMPETAGTRLADYGVTFITSTRRGKSSARARLELRERAQQLQAYVLEKFHVRSVVGIGSTLAPGSSLYQSHREAVLALHMCVQLEKDVLFYDEHGGEASFRYTDLQRAGQRLLDAFAHEVTNEIKLASDNYVRFVLRYSDERIEVVRSQFLAMLFQLLHAIERKNPMREDARDSFANDLTSRLEETGSLYQLIEAFKEALLRLSFMASRALQGPKVMRLEATLQYLRENFAEPLRLPDVARKGGFSVAAFSRVFRQATGTSFLAYLRAIRVEHAKKLLATTPMTTEQVAQACGFQSQHHLIRSFKKVAGRTPGTHRRTHANLHREPTASD
jgi:AraC-like DNA-binding protein